MSWHSRLRNIFRPRQLENELDEEMQFHADQLPPERQFGSLLRYREESRDIKLLPWLESILQDARFALRLMRKSPAFTVTAIVSLALALGANAGVYALVNAILLRPLPTYQPERLVYLTFPNRTEPGRTLEEDSFSYPLFRRLRDVAKGAANLFIASYGGQQPAVVDGRDDKIDMQWVSGDLFARLGFQPALGRLLTNADDRQMGQHPVAVLSYGYWQRRFGGDPAVIGRWLQCADYSYQIIGVAPRGFTGVEPGRFIDVFVPALMWDSRAIEHPDMTWFRILGRLEDRASREQLRQRLQVVYSDFFKERSLQWPAGIPKQVIDEVLSRPIHVQPASAGVSSLRAHFIRPLWVLGGVAVGILLIACAVLANLLLARAATREREMALRVSIGAGRGRLLQQLLIECGLLAGCAAALGCIIAANSAAVITGMLSSRQNPVQLEAGLDWRVLAVMSALALVTTLLFGLVPAWRASSWRASTRVTAKSPLSRALVGAQVAFCILVLFMAGLFLRTFEKLSSVKLGFEPRNLLVAEIDAPSFKKEPGKAIAAWNALRRRAALIPGVEHASLSNFALIGSSTWSGLARVPGTEHVSEDISALGVLPGFFQTTRMRLLSGRDFSEAEADAGITKVAVVNAAFARKLFAGRDPVGRRFEAIGSEDKYISYEIIGLVEDARYSTLREPAPPLAYFLPPQWSWPWQTIQLRTKSARAVIAQQMRQAASQVSSALIVRNVYSQSQFIDDAMITERLLAVLSSFFSTVAILLAAIGLYGVLSYLVVQRNKEIGIRLALGSSRGNVVGLVVRDSLAVTALGIAAGLAGGLALGRFVEKLLFEVRPDDTLSVALPALCLLAAAAIAALPPVWRAAHVDPGVALRYE